MRYSMKTMLTAFTFVSVSCVGVLYANPILASCFITVAFLILLIGILVARLCGGRQRAFWIGFAVFGWGYFLVSMFGERYIDPGIPSAVTILPTGAKFSAEPRLVTTQFLIWAHENISQLVSSGNQPPMYYRLLFFLTIGHAIFTVLFALIGGVLGRWLGQQYAANDTHGTTAGGT